MAHADVYTKVRLHRFGLTDEDRCARCGATETLEHKIYTCDYAKRIWLNVTKLTNENLNADPLKTILGANLNLSLPALTIKAEILGRILSLMPGQNFLIHPKHLEKLSIENLIRKEKSTQMKDGLKDILSRLDTQG